MEYIIIFSTLVVIEIVILIREKHTEKVNKIKAIELISEEFLKPSDKELSLYELERIRKSFERFKTEFSIDDLTADDLGLLDIYKRFCKANSQMGQDVFYQMLRNPLSKEELNKLDAKTDYLIENPEERKSLSYAFYKIGSMNKVSLLECLDLFRDIEESNLFVDYLSIALLFIAIIFCFINAPFGIVSLVVVLIINILTYYKKRGKIEPFMVCFAYILKFLIVSKQICKTDYEGLNEELLIIKDIEKKFRRFENLFLFISKRPTQGTGTGNPLEIIMDYLRMLIHIDIIAFYKMLKDVKKNIEDIEKLYLLLGYIESLISIASIRTIYDTCKPTEGEEIIAYNMYHPLIKDPVKNSITTDKNVLITGSNASGKSTFLKMTALNVLFSKTIYTCFADTFITDNYHIMSSMSLKDDLIHGESYFIVEIKAIKRIIDFANAHKDIKILCFVDEVLRGTNTVERIAASSEILKGFPENVWVFAATHDIELTYILEESFSNYHFNETVHNDDVSFEYLIKEGRANSRNAIKLLSIIGFSNEIVENARKNADRFIETGEWK